jgi:hypothetical protein
MKHYKNINGSTVAVVFHIVLILLGGVLAFVVSNIQALSILMVPIALMLTGGIVLFVSKWKKIKAGDFQRMGPGSDVGLSIFLYKFGYVLLLSGVVFALMKLF